MKKYEIIPQLSKALWHRIITRVERCKDRKQAEQEQTVIPRLKSKLTRDREIMCVLMYNTAIKQQV